MSTGALTISVTGMRRAGTAAALVIAGSGALLLGRHAYMQVKAAVAAQLIEQALAAHLEDGETHRPWSWSDLEPVARLEVRRLGVRRPVLTGATGSSMAFGIGHLDGSAPPNGRGNCVLAGHRDRWFAFLADLVTGDRLRLETAHGYREYVVEHLAVVDESDLGVTDASADDRLTLVTCYPFDGLTASPWRFVVHCVPVPSRKRSVAGLAPGCPGGEVGQGQRNGLAGVVRIENREPASHLAV